MVRIGKGDPSRLSRLAVPTPNQVRGTGSITIPAERMKRLQESFIRLESAKDELERFFPCIFDLIAEILPGKRIARLDILRLEGDTCLTSPRFESRDGSYAFGGEMDITPVLQRSWHELGVTGSPEFEAAMQAMNEGKEVRKNEGGESFLARPLLGKKNMLLGAMVLANQTLRGTSLITPEDEEVLNLFAQKVSDILKFVK